MTLYHLIHRPFFGTTLYPLSELRHVDPALFEKQKAKYDGRESLSEYGIEAFDCRWNDVIHLSPVHPKSIFTALKKAGYPQSEKRHPYFFALDPRALDPLLTIFFHPPHGQEENYNPRKVRKYSTLPKATKEYYKEAIARRESPLLWNLTTLVLYKGTIDISAIPIIDRDGVVLEDKAKIFAEARG
ncbi:MAG: hypothetical protein AABX98_06755 [Nanoarchaeota archaeon]